MSKNEQVDSPKFYITGLRKSEVSGEVLVDYQLTEEFKTWYKDKNNLKRWSRKRFEKELTTMVKSQMADQLGLVNTEQEKEA
tara:strand:+ start:2035 stop:2280 length:246 start_codon:yes stop_codon:yes gene_type:complete